MTASESAHADASSPAAPAEDLVGSSAAGPAALRGSMLVSGSYAATILLSLVAAPLLIRHLGLATYGRYATVIAIVTVVGGLTDGGLLSIGVREWATHAGTDRRWLMSGLLGLRIELSVVGVVAGVGFALVAGYGSAMVTGTLIAGVGMMFQVIANLLTVALQGDLRFGWASIVNVCRQAVATALIVALVLAGSGLVPFFAVTVPAALTAVLMTAILVRGRMPLIPRFRGGGQLQIMRDTIAYAAAIAVNSLYFRVTIIAMSLIATSLQTGYFATSFRVTEVLVGVPSLAVGAAFPVLARAAKDDHERFAYATGRIIELSLIAGAALALFVVLVAPFAVFVLAGAKGAPAGPVLQIQGLALVATFMSAATGYTLLSLRRHRALLISNSAALIANVVLTIVLVPLAQARGAAVAAAVAESCLAIAQIVLLVRAGHFRLRPRALVDVAVAAAIGTVALAIPVASEARTLIGLLLFTVALAGLGRFPPELRHALHGQRLRLRLR